MMARQARGAPRLPHGTPTPAASQSWQLPPPVDPSVVGPSRYTDPTACAEARPLRPLLTTLEPGTHTELTEDLAPPPRDEALARRRPASARPSVRPWPQQQRAAAARVSNSRDASGGGDDQAGGDEDAGDDGVGGHKGAGGGCGVGALAGVSAELRSHARPSVCGAMGGASADASLVSSMSTPRALARPHSATTRITRALGRPSTAEHRQRDIANWLSEANSLASRPCSTRPHTAQPRLRGAAIGAVPNDDPGSPLELVISLGGAARPPSPRGRPTSPPTSSPRMSVRVGGGGGGGVYPPHLHMHGGTRAKAAAATVGGEEPAVPLEPPLGSTESGSLHGVGAGGGAPSPVAAHVARIRSARQRVPPKTSDALTPLSVTLLNGDVFTAVSSLEHRGSFIGIARPYSHAPIGGLTLTSISSLLSPSPAPLPAPLPSPLFSPLLSPLLSPLPSPLPSPSPLSSSRNIRLSCMRQPTAKECTSRTRRFDAMARDEAHADALESCAQDLRRRRRRRVRCRR